MKKQRSRTLPRSTRVIRPTHARPDYGDVYDFIVQQSMRVGIEAGIAKRFAKSFVTAKLQEYRKRNIG